MKTYNTAELRRLHIRKLTSFQKTLFALGIFGVRIRVITPISYRVAKPIYFYNPLTWLLIFGVLFGLVATSLLESIGETITAFRTTPKIVNLYSNNTLKTL